MVGGKRRRDDSGSTRSQAASDKEVNERIFLQCILPRSQMVEIKMDESEEFTAFAAPRVFVKSSTDPYTAERQFGFDIFSELIQDELNEVCNIFS